MFKKLEIIDVFNEEFKKTIKAIVIDGELFDWGIDINSFNQMRQMIQKHKEMAETVSMSIINHFIECFSDYIGKKITLEEIIDAIKSGYIEI